VPPEIRYAKSGDVHIAYQVFGKGPENLQNYAEAFHTAWSDQPNAVQLLSIVAADQEVPAFARASALTDLAPSLSPANGNLAQA